MQSVPLPCAPTAVEACGPVVVVAVSEPQPSLWVFLSAQFRKAEGADATTPPPPAAVLCQQHTCPIISLSCIPCVDARMKKTQSDNNNNNNNNNNNHTSRGDDIPWSGVHLFSVSEDAALLWRISIVDDCGRPSVRADVLANMQGPLQSTLAIARPPDHSTSDDVTATLDVRVCFDPRSATSTSPPRVLVATGTTAVILGCAAGDRTRAALSASGDTNRFVKGAGASVGDDGCSSVSGGQYLPPQALCCGYVHAHGCTLALVVFDDGSCRAWHGDTFARVADWMACDSEATTETSGRRSRTGRGVLSMCAHSELPVVAVALNDGTVRVLQLVPVVKRMGIATAAGVGGLHARPPRAEQQTPKMYFVQVYYLGSRRYTSPPTNIGWSDDFDDCCDDPATEAAEECNEHVGNEGEGDHNGHEIGGTLRMRFLNQKTRTPTCHLVIASSSKPVTVYAIEGGLTGKRDSANSRAFQVRDTSSLLSGTAALFQSQHGPSACPWLINTTSSSADTGDDVLVALGSLFEAQVCVGWISNTTICPARERHEQHLTLFPTEPAPPTSVLSQVMMNVTINESKDTRDAAHKRKTKRTNATTWTPPKKPLSKVKSSGYGATPPVMGLFQGTRSGLKHKKKSNADRVRARSAAIAARTGQKMYPTDSGPCVVHQPEHSLDLIGRQGRGSSGSHDSSKHRAHQGAAITSLEFSPDGMYIASASSDKTVRVMRLPVNRFQGEGRTLLGHATTVQSVRWSHTERVGRGRIAMNLTNTRGKARHSSSGGAHAIVSSARDGVCKIWTGDDTKATATLQHKSGHSLGALVPGAAQFFYMDRFLFVGAWSGPVLYPLDGLLGDVSTEPNRSVESTSTSTSVLPSLASPSGSSHMFHSWNTSAHGGVTCIAASNAFMSNLLLAGTSNGSLCAIDAATDQVTKLGRAALCHAIVLPEASAFAPHPPESYDIFATLSSATLGGSGGGGGAGRVGGTNAGVGSGCGTALLWDLRSPGGVVREFIGHQDRGVANVGGAFSPCLRFLAIGSEDQAAHVYDLRLPRAITKVRGCHKDAITDVSFHPRHPQLATAGLDGRIEFFRSQE